ncbi:MAG: DUF2304 domain-containing protein [Patescibacteria group bacterium]|nr:DUF2304 domain-containing protein [Patescibacteria group bacterium]MDD5121008.1 DUF2304 domain-containing protein [Patescibacteria group bacterium]MDD5221631.1 DUF2304 domain-containing protein [Patescibacteria group bacterium]MDD5396073.1 DUF2304 domain-containing protein [Patescibacteria group bacterium]
MLFVQFLIDLVIIFFVVNLFLKLRQNKINFGSFIFWLILWVAAAILVNWPESSSFVARILGVGRGVDVVIYFSIILLFYFIFYLTIKLRRTEKEITDLVRKISFLEDKATK